jgi:cobalamin transport system substrate-binding protein
VARAGGRNVASALPKKWALYKREAIVEDDPDVIFILARSNADFETGRAKLVKMPGLAGVKAVRTGRIFEIDENAASRFGPRLVDVLARMAALIHPERFGGAA